jgi:penicillin-binding protein 2
MERRSRFRIGVFLVIVALMMGLFALRLYKLQAVSPETAETAAKANSMTYRTTVAAARGNILDRNGNVLVTNRASYNLVIINYVLFNSKTPNESLLSVLELCDKLGIRYESHFPVSEERPYTYYTDELSSVWQGYFREFLQYHDYDTDISAATLMRNLRADYKIPDDWTPEQVYKVLSVRYELELRSIDGVGLENYTLATDVDAQDLASVMELGVPGVVVESGTVREYNTKYAAHLLGFIGAMDPDQYQTYKDEGYAMNALVGQSGAELAFEQYLHGTDGLKSTTVSTTGEVLDQYYMTVPKPGDNVELTVDISLQATAENALAKVIQDLRTNGLLGKSEDGKDAEGGAVVVQKIKTGEILAMASYPTYDPATYRKDYTALSKGEFSPLYNRALQGEYPPGSVYKMVTADAAIDYGGIGQYYEITDKGKYTFYEKNGYTCNCYLYTSSGLTHGTINMQQALAVSCNYYFYEAGRLTYYSYYDKTKQNALDIVAKALGLGESTGIELQENTGTRANAETKKKLYGDDADWYGADVLQAAIGQSDNRFTPLQLVCYTSALANGGVRYKATVLSRVVSWNYEDLIKKQTPVVASTLQMSDEAKECIKTGMEMAATSGTAASYFKNYPIKVACKTGTAQHGNTDMGSDNASFVLYAPADDPEIAISVYVEKGAQGGYLANVCIPILDSYFSVSSKYETTATENIAH